MNEESPKQSTAVQKFWDAFKACVEDNRVRPDRSLFYVKWAQAFVDFLPGKRLRHRLKWGGIASHGAIIKCLHPGVGMTGGHVEEAGLFVNDIVINTSRVSINHNMIYPGIINELGGMGQEKGRVFLKSTGPRKPKEGIIVCVYFH